MPPLWSFGYQQSHRTLAGPEQRSAGSRGTLREKNLPCDALIYLGTDFTPSGWNTHNGEFTWKTENFPEPEEDDRRAARAALQGRAARRHRGRRLHGTREGPCTAPRREPSGRTPEGAWPPDRQRQLLLAASQAVCRSRRRRLVARSGRRPRRDRRGSIASACTGKAASCAGRSERAVRAAPQRLSPAWRAMARSSGRATSYSTWETLKTHVPVAINTGLTGIPYWGTDIGGFVPTRGFHRRAVRALVPVRRVLSAVPRARTRLAAAPAVGLEPRRDRPGEIDSTYCGAPAIRRRKRAAQRAGRADLPEVSRAAVSPDAVPLLGGPRGAATGLPIIRALWLHYPDDPLGRRPRRSVPVGPRHPRRARRRERRDVARALPAARRVVRLLDRSTRRGRPRDRSRRSISRRCRCTSVPARSCRWAR